MFASWSEPSKSAGVGRVNLDNAEDLPSWMANVPGFSYKTSDTNYEKDMLRGNWESTAVSKGFFSQENINVIQNALRKSVYDKSGSKKWIIDNQSVDEIKIIMRAMFLQYAKNLDTDVPGQIDTLNKLVIDWSTPHLLATIDGYYGYLKDITTMPKQMERPMSMSSAGTKSLPFNNFI